MAEDEGLRSKLEQEILLFHGSRDRSKCPAGNSGRGQHQYCLTADRKLIHGDSSPVSNRAYIFAKLRQSSHDLILCPFYQLNRSTVRAEGNFLSSVQFEIPALIFANKPPPFTVRSSTAAQDATVRS